MKFAVSLRRRRACPRLLRGHGADMDIDRNRFASTPAVLQRTFRQAINDAGLVQTDPFGIDRTFHPSREGMRERHVFHLGLLLELIKQCR